MTEPYWLEPHDICTILRCSIDGNKRIALIAVYTFLAINAIELIASETDAASFFLDLAASLGTQEEDMNRLANWLQINSEPIVD